MITNLAMCAPTHPIQQCRKINSSNPSNSALFLCFFFAHSRYEIQGSVTVVSFPVVVAMSDSDDDVSSQFGYQQLTLLTL